MYSIGLVHYPVYNKRKDVVATAVTIMDVHDLSRLGRTYGLDNYFVITPTENQQEIVKRTLGYWQFGFGKIYNDNRAEAFSITKLVSSIEEAVELLRREKGNVKVVVTSAKRFENTITYEELGKKIKEGKEHFLVLFGTGWGLAKEVMEMADFVLEPIKFKSDYNHLSVRSAASIIVDRLSQYLW